MNDTRRHVLGRWFLAAGLAGAIAAFLLPPLHQPQSYHHFADQRTAAGIPNALNVLSNLPFLAAGALGLSFVLSRGQFQFPGEKTAYAVFFTGACATCFGSGYYHWNPDDATLVWDRLPMTLAFMSLLAAMIIERISPRIGRRLLWPLVVAGAFSVGWWQWTGNLWPYAVDQYLSILLIILMLILAPSRYDRQGDMALVTGLYALAKIFEASDQPVYRLLHWVSGHTIKHLVAAGAVFAVLHMLRKRRPAV